LQARLRLRHAATRLKDLNSADARYALEQAAVRREAARIGAAESR
ncbi:MAG: F0F1 ATP synthase subunit epsilon, partial [Myxococcaceae bacterium]